MAAPQLAAGFADPVHASQRCFRAVMDAMARPGTIHAIEELQTVPAPLNRAAAAVLLSLADFDTPLWFDDGFVDSGALDWLKFHTGAPVTMDSRAASFAMICSVENLPAFDNFAEGTIEYPDRSATLILQVDRIEEGQGWRLTGPGIAEEHRLSLTPTPPDFIERWAANRDRFPLGIDLVACSDDAVACLPRTTTIAEG